jgi:hypothetical protein
LAFVGAFFSTAPSIRVKRKSDIPRSSSVHKKIFADCIYSASLFFAVFAAGGSCGPPSKFTIFFVIFRFLIPNRTILSSFFNQFDCFSGLIFVKTSFIIRASKRGWPPEKIDSTEVF